VVDALALRIDVPLDVASASMGRRRFVGDEVLRVSPIGDGPALAHHPGTDARAAHAARGDQASVAVAGPRLAGHGSPADVLGQRIRGRLAAPPWLATEVTQLAGLWRVDAVQSDTLPVNLEYVLPALRAVHVARPQRASLQVAVLVEHEKRMIAGALEVAVVGRAPSPGNRLLTSF
jgi:hypothetical protein